MEHYRDTRQPASRMARLLRDRRTRFIAIPVAVIATALTINYAAQAASDTSPARSEAGSARPAENKQETKTVTDQTSPKQTESVTDDGSGRTTNVTVNGESVTVPENGTYQRSTDDGTTRTDVKVDSRNQSSTSGDGASNSSSSKIQVNVQSNSSSESVSN